MVIKADLIRQWYQQNAHKVKPEELTKIAEGAYEQNPKAFGSFSLAYSAVRGVRRSKQGFSLTPENHDLTSSPELSSHFTKNKLRSMFDIRTIVLNILEELPYSKEGIIYQDAEFAKRFGLVGRPGYRSMLDSPETKPYRARNGRKIFWAHPKTIQELIQEGVLYEFN